MKKNNKFTVRQGDVLIQRIDKIPSGLMKQHKPVHGRIILASGEATGHHHSIDMDAADHWKHAEGRDDQDQYVRVKSETALQHQEHAPLTLPPGDYIVRRQREYKPAGIVRVAD